MDFESEVGKRFNRIVSIWQPNPATPPILGFGVRDFRTDELLEKLGYTGKDTMSLRIYRLETSGSGEKFVRGDLWEVEVIRCTFNPDSKLTKDDRRKILFTVKPVRRVETVQKTCDFERKMLKIERVCGDNRQAPEWLPCEIRTSHYRLDNSTYVEVEEVHVDGKPQGIYEYELGPISYREFLRNRRALVGNVDEARIRAVFDGFPLAPERLRKKYLSECAA